ncbi:MAG: sensor histidine kinase KdpD [Oscillospiraceae bacterium]
MNESRKNPYDILNKIKTDEKLGGYGKLKIFFGYAAGVGKTYAMLKEAHIIKKQGIDVVIGYIEPHTRPETAVLVSGLNSIPALQIKHKDITLREFNLDEALRRRPQVILVDELAHTNADGCRHTKRYKDVEELLRAGIDVYTTVNVQHIESLNDIVSSITGVIVGERIPDTVFDSADTVKIVDIEPKDLIERLKSGKIYKETQVDKALNNFFTEENLIALREIALRRSADRINKISEKTKPSTNREYYTDEHILVCLSSSPSNDKLIRNASRMANAFKGRFTALFVETPNFMQMTDEDKNRLRKNIRLAQQLGASIETVCGDNVAYQIAEFSRLASVSKIIIGRSGARRKTIFSKTSFSEELTRLSPNLDIYIIPDQNTSHYRKKPIFRNIKISAKDIFKAFGVLVLVTLIGLLFDRWGFNETNIITIYILGVLVISILAPNRLITAVVSLVSVLTFNFFFTVPRFTLDAYNTGYPVTFAIMFASAFLTGNLAIKIKQQAHVSAQNAYRTKILLDTNQLLQQKKNANEIFEVLANQLNKLLSKDIVYYVAGENKLSEPIVFPADLEKHETDLEKYKTENEKAVASWVYKNNKHAGASTDTLCSSKCLYLSVRGVSEVFGVVGISLEHDRLEAFESNLVLSILGECGLVLEKELSYQREQKALILAKNEQLKANILRTISHDLRTPLTSISGNAGLLINNGDALNEPKKKELYTDIYDDSIWLIDLVENLLSVTRIEDGSLKLNMHGELIDEVITEALRHVNRKLSEHEIVVLQDEEFLMAKMDSRLIVQVIINIVNNAIKYTESGSRIVIKTFSKSDKVMVEISDTGEGISDKSKEKIFDMFYTVNGKIADGRRSLGLGLALCKSIIVAHGGEITLRENTPHGAIFSFSLQKEEVNLNV